MWIWNHLMIVISPLISWPIKSSLITTNRVLRVISLIPGSSGCIAHVTPRPDPWHMITGNKPDFRNEIELKRRKTCSRTEVSLLIDKTDTGVSQLSNILQTTNLSLGSELQLIRSTKIVTWSRTNKTAFIMARTNVGTCSSLAMDNISGTFYHLSYRVYGCYWRSLLTSRRLFWSAASARLTRGGAWRSPLAPSPSSSWSGVWRSFT